MRPKLEAPIQTTGVETTTHEGGAAFERTSKSELFLLAVTNMVNEDTYYELRIGRDARYAELIYKVTADDPDWVRRFLPWLRDTANMRSAAVVGVAEYIKAGGPHGRQLVADTLLRADEPAELLAYWHATHGKRLPKPLKRGLAVAVAKLYNEKAMLKYDSSRHAVRPTDVITLAHAKPVAPWQLELFVYLSDKRHGRTDPRVGKQLQLVSKSKDVTEKLEAGVDVTAEEVRAGGITWERQSGATKMDAAAWERQIPSMGYMALLRNLRNFDEAGISADARTSVVAKLTNPAEVARSRQFPYRFLSAYKAAPSLQWAQVLETALDLSCGNIPRLRGRSLVLIDLSGSMTNKVSAKSEMSRWEVGALFAAALSKRCEQVDIALFATNNGKLPMQRSESILRYMERVAAVQRSGQLQHGTMGYTALADQYDGHDRAVFFTDEQLHDSSSGRSSGSYYYSNDSSEGVAAKVPTIWTFNLAGYAPAMMENGTNGRFAMGGFTDATFKVMEAIENSQDGRWPF